MLTTLKRLIPCASAPPPAWRVMFRSTNGELERLGFFTGDADAALECGKVWLAMRVQQRDTHSFGRLELHPHYLRLPRP